MGEYLYVPSLKSKRGERSALNELSSSVKKKIKPIYNIISIDHAARLVSGSAFIDLHPNLVSGGVDLELVFQQIFSAIRNKSELTTVIKHGYSQEFMKNIKPYILNCENGVALRIPNAYLSSLGSDLISIKSALGLGAEQVDVIIDFGQVNEVVLGLINAISTDIKAHLRDLKVRNVIILSSAFPTGLSVPKDSISELPRNDFLLFKGIRKQLPGIILGDYGADDPDDPQVDTGRIIVPTIRYTRDSCWKIIRGHYDPAMPYDFSQYYDLSRVVRSSDFYMGKDYSCGDSKIDLCAKHESSSGNSETWVKVAMNHHITFVVNEYDRLL